MYCANGLAFTLPERRWVDRTDHALDAPTSADRTCSLAVHRTRLEPGDQLDALVDRALRRAEREKHGHAILHRARRTIAGRSAIDVAVRWHSARSMAYTRQAHLTAAGFWLVFGFTAWVDDAAACDEHMERLIDTLQLRT